MVFVFVEIKRCWSQVFFFSMDMQHANRFIIVRLSGIHVDFSWFLSILRAQVISEMLVCLVMKNCFLRMCV